MMFSMMTTHDEFVADVLRRFQETTMWSDAQLSSMVSVLSDAFADLGVSDAYAIRFAAREAFIHLCKRDSSAYEGARFLGTPIGRKGAASVSVLLTNNTGSDVYVNKWDTFDVGGRSAYATASMMIKAAESKEVNLTLGTVGVKQFSLASASDYATFDLGVPGFSVCYIEAWTESASGSTTQYGAFNGSLFEMNPGDLVYLDRTTAEGDVEIQFGGQLWGKVPDRSHTLNVRYCVTNGLSDNLEFTGLQVTSYAVSGLQGKTTEYIVGGADQKGADFYRQFAPILSRSKKKPVTPEEWKALVADYPGVADCVVLGQRDIAPNDPTWMSVIRICVLPDSASNWGGVNPNPTSAKWSEFLTYIETLKPFLTVQTWNPSKLLIDLQITVCVFDTVDLKAMESILTTAVLDVFKRKTGTLGRKIALDDILDAIKFDGDSRREGIDYTNILSPTEDVVPTSKLEYVGLRNLKIDVKYTDRR